MTNYTELLNPHSVIYWDFNKEVQPGVLWQDFESFIRQRALSCCGTTCLRLENIAVIDVYDTKTIRRWTFRVTVRPKIPNPNATVLEEARSYIEKWTKRFDAKIHGRGTEMFKKELGEL